MPEKPVADRIRGLQRLIVLLAREDEGSVLAGFPKVGETLIVDTLDLEHHA